METDLKKQLKAIDLAILSGQKRLSPRTGFVHLHPSGEEFADTVPLYENFCYALALFRQKTAESVLAAIDLVRRLLSFQVPDGNFPVFLHEYPKTHDFHMGLKVAAILTYLLKLFPNVLGDLKPLLENALALTLSKVPEKPFWLNRYRALKNLPLLDLDPAALTLAEWTDFLITEQLAGKNHFDLPYDAENQLFGLSAPQEKGEPRPHPIEWILAEGRYASRFLKDHPHQLLCAPLFPFSYTPTPLPDSSFRLFWQGKTLHSLVGKGLVFDLPENIEMGRGDLFEAALYCDRSAETEILIEGKKGSLFQLGETVTIQTPQKTVHLRFFLKEGSGDFCGHIFFANRPSQVAKGHEAYDWQIGLRTLRRSPKVRIEILVTQYTQVN